jgi:hypothetical protein
MSTNFNKKILNFCKKYSIIKILKKHFDYKTINLKIPFDFENIISDYI